MLGAMTKLVLALALLATACSKGGGAPRDCAAAADNALAISKDELAKIPGMANRFDAVTKALLARCTEDGWPSAVITCIAGARSQDAMRACNEQLTSGQQAKLRAATMQAMGLGGGGGPARPADPVSR